jgi:hypothetical protein
MPHTKGPIFMVFKIIPSAATIVHGDIPRSIALVLGASRLLAMAKDIGDLRFIIIGEVFL